MLHVQCIIGGMLAHMVWSIVILISPIFSKKDELEGDEDQRTKYVLAAAWMADMFFVPWLNSAWSKVQSSDAII